MGVYWNDIFGSILAEDPIWPTRAKRENIGYNKKQKVAEHDANSETNGYQHFLLTRQDMCSILGRNDGFMPKDKHLNGMVVF